MDAFFGIDIPGISIEGLPDTIGLIIAVAGFLLVISVIWLVIKTIFKVAMRIFWTGCLMILCLGAFLVMAAFLTTGL